jgi:hypothetical protein
LYKDETGNAMANTRVPSILWNVDQTNLLLDDEKRQARKNIGLVDKGTENIPIYFNSSGDPVRMGHTTESNSKWPSGSDSGIPMVKTTSNSVCAGWAALSTSSYYGVAVEVGSGQTNRGLWSTIPNQSSGATASIDDNWLIAKGASRNSIFLNRHPATSDSELCDFANNGGGYAFARLVSPNWNNIRTSGIYGIYNSSAPGTNGSPDSGRVCLLVGDAYSVNATSGLPGTSATDHYTTQLAMGGDMLYRTKVGNADWESWRPVLTQYKDTVTSAIYGYKLATTTVSSTLGDRTHYTALISITPLKHADRVNKPYLAYLDIYQVKESDKDRCTRTLRMLSTVDGSDYGGLSGQFVITGSNEGSDNGNYQHDWYIRRGGQNDTINDFSITVTPLLCEGSVLFKGLERATSPVTSSYIEYGKTTPSINSRSYTYYPDVPLYLDYSGDLHPCDPDELSLLLNGTDVGSSTMPVYIKDGKPTDCSIIMGTGTTAKTIVNHMYTAVPIATANSHNAGGAHTMSADVTIVDQQFPSVNLPFRPPRKWPAGLMMFANVSVWIQNNGSDYIDIKLFQDSTQLADHRYGMPSTSYAGYLSATFFGVTVDDVDINTHFYIKVGTPSGDATVHAFTYNISSII